MIGSKFIEKWKFKLTGKSVPVVKVADIDEEGRINTLMILGDVKDRPNSLVESWNQKAWEKEQGTHMIQVVDQNGRRAFNWIVSEAGRTVDLYVHPYFKNPMPDREDILGKGATMDDIAEAMDLGKSTKNYIIGGVMSAPVWWIVFQVLGAMAK